MRSKNLEEAIDLLLRLPRIMKGSMQREIFKSPLQSIDAGLAPHHTLIMKIVDDEGMLNISEIGDIAMISRAQMTQSIDKLTSLGMLRRVPDPADRRKIGIALTEKGKRATAACDAAVKKHFTETLSWLSDEELGKMLDSLKFLVATFERYK
jgi:DNA-binding MarR family transcriptional regulator